MKKLSKFLVRVFHANWLKLVFLLLLACLLIVGMLVTIIIIWIFYLWETRSVETKTCLVEIKKCLFETAVIRLVVNGELICI